MTLLLLDYIHRIDGVANLKTGLFDLKSSLTSSPFCLDSNPRSTYIQVSDLISSLKTGPFTAIRPGTTTTPTYQATIDR